MAVSLSEKSDRTNNIASEDSTDALQMLLSPNSILSKRVIGIAIQPALARLRGGNDRMSSRLGMLAGVLIRRAVATQCLAALLTCSQVHPAGPDLHTFSALTATRMFNRGDGRKMGTTSTRHTSHRFQIFMNELDCH